jgi:hypothetical protein
MTHEPLGEHENNAAAATAIARKPKILFISKQTDYPTNILNTKVNYYKIRHKKSGRLVSLPDFL